jgi:peptide/nickel transport system permease protein
MHRFRFVLYRPFQLLPVLFGISVVTFVLIHAIPGDPVRAILGPKATPEVIERIRAEYGLDKPVVVQYFYFLKNVARGEMGKSIVFKTAVVGLVMERFEATIFLLGYGVVLALFLTVPLAVTAAVHRGKRPDHLIRMFSTAGLGFPAFWLGIMLMIVFSVRRR